MMHVLNLQEIEVWLYLQQRRATNLTRDGKICCEWQAYATTTFQCTTYMSQSGHILPDSCTTNIVALHRHCRGLQRKAGAWLACCQEHT